MTDLSDRPELVAAFEGPNGARVEVYDESRAYAYANVFHVRLRVVGRFADGEGYERILERLGVFESDVPSVREAMLENFRTSALPYLLRPDFPERLADYRHRSRLARATLRVAP